MALPKNPYDNKRHYDPGRMRHSIAIMNYAVTNDGYGGTNVTEQQVLATKAGKDEVSDYKKAQLVEGFTNYETAIYFVIRNRKNFYPDKTMHINYAGKTYTIISVKELDDPCTFLKILCVNSESPTQSSSPVNDLFVNGYLNDNGIIIDSQIYDFTQSSSPVNDLFVNGYLNDNGIIIDSQIYNLT